jgi:zinc D-Ala-D-Ala dipeptidase
MKYDVGTPQKRRDWKSIGIIECGERLVSLKGLHSRIYVEPYYYIRSIRGAINDCIVRETVAEKLRIVADNLPTHLGLVIFDGWRSSDVQSELFNNYREALIKEFPDIPEDELDRKVTMFVSLASRNPLCPSPHLTGGSIDLSIIDNDHNFIPMGTPFDDFSIESHTAYYEELALNRKLNNDEVNFMRNRRHLNFAMTSVGFTNFPTEWWHYDYGNQFWASFSGSEYAIYGKASP